MVLSNDHWTQWKDNYFSVHKIDMVEATVKKPG